MTPPSQRKSGPLLRQQIPRLWAFKGNGGVNKRENATNPRALRAYGVGLKRTGEGGIRTRETGVNPSDGLANRCSDSVSGDGTTTYGDGDRALTALLTDFFRKWPEFTAQDRSRVFAFCKDGLDPELRAVVTAWPEAPEPVRAGILAMLEATKPTL